jgi:hypothetical protein
MRIRYVINQHHCDKIKDYPHVNIKYLKNSTFNTLKLVYGYLFILVTRIKNCLFYHAFTQLLNKQMKFIIHLLDPC